MFLNIYVYSKYDKTVAFFKVLNQFFHTSAAVGLGLKTVIRVIKHGISKNFKAILSTYF